MECIAPHEITEEQLLAYADGEADSATIEHVRRCPYCAKQAHAYAANQTILRALFHRVECPDAHTLCEYRQDLLSPAERVAIEEHLRVCPDCAAELTSMEQFLQAVPVNPTLSSTLHGQLKRLVARPAPLLPSLENHQQLALAFRGATATPPDIYQAADIKLVIGLEVDGFRAGRKMLLGFTTREGKPLASLKGAWVQLSHRGETVAIEQVDKLGNFVFSDLVSGEYQLVLATDQEHVVVETIMV